MSKRDQWRKTLEEQLPIKDEERQSVRRIMSRLRGNPPAAAPPQPPETAPPTGPNSADTPAESRPVKNLDRSENLTGQETRPVKASTVSKTRPVKNLDRSEERRSGYLKLPNEILDNVLPRLSPTEAVVFLRLYRLSIGFGVSRCMVGITALIQACNISEQTCRTALRRLIDMGHIKQIEVINTREMKGTAYEILTGLENIPVKNLDRSENLTGLEIRPNKDHDHDFKNTDLRQSAHAREVTTIYQKLTGNNWTRADQSAYEKIKDVPVEMIEQVIRVTIARAARRPGSLAYFIKEILALSDPSASARKANRGQLQTIIERLRTAHTGATYTIGELAEDTKLACVRDGLIFDLDLFNEIVN